jgi:hypothetical protein
MGAPPSGAVSKWGRRRSRCQVRGRLRAEGCAGPAYDEVIRGGSLRPHVKRRRSSLPPMLNLCNHDPGEKTQADEQADGGSFQGRHQAVASIRLRMMRNEDVATVRVDLAEPASDHAGTLQAEVDPSDATEQAADGESHNYATLRRSGSGATCPGSRVVMRIARELPGSSGGRLSRSSARLSRCRWPCG